MFTLPAVVTTMRPSANCNICNTMLSHSPSVASRQENFLSADSADTEMTDRNVTDRKHIMNARLNILHQYIPYSDDMTYATGQYKEMEHQVHIFPLVEAVKQGTCNISHAFGTYPYQRRRTHTVEERFESSQDRQRNTNNTASLEVTVLLQFYKSPYRTCNRTRLDIAKQAPSPV